MNVVSLWDNVPSKAIKQPTNNKTKTLEKSVSKKVYADNTKVKKLTNTPLYVIQAFVNKQGRQMYLSGYEDCSDWSISAVPHPTNYKKCEILINKAQKAYECSPKIFGKNATMPDFKITEWSDKRA